MSSTPDVPADILARLEDLSVDYSPTEWQLGVVCVGAACKQFDRCSGDGWWFLFMRDSRTGKIGPVVRAKDVCTLRTWLNEGKAPAHLVRCEGKGAYQHVSVKENVEEWTKQLNEMISSVELVKRSGE
jgi:hypothetical protein